MRTSHKDIKRYLLDTRRYSIKQLKLPAGFNLRTDYGKTGWNGIVETFYAHIPHSRDHVNGGDNYQTVLGWDKWQIFTVSAFERLLREWMLVANQVLKSEIISWRLPVKLKRKLREDQKRDFTAKYPPEYCQRMLELIRKTDVFNNNHPIKVNKFYFEESADQARFI